jgi:hypothetical protein
MYSGAGKLNILTEVKRVQQVNDKAACEKAGGKWQVKGDTPIVKYGCNMPTSDAGKVCSDRSDCQTICLAPTGTRMGSKATGKCWGWTFFMQNCNPQVGKGIVLPGSCE